MSEPESPTPPPPNNPFQEVCVYLSQQGNDFALAELIKRFGFTVYAFVSLPRMCAHLQQNPLTAAAFVQGDLAALEPTVRETYHGPLYALAEDKATMLENLGQNLREVHQNQMKVQDPKVLRILKSFDAFISGSSRTLLLLGDPQTLETARDFLTLMAAKTVVEVGDALPEELPAAANELWITRNLFDHEISWQQRWNVIFGEATTPHLILEAKSTEDLDRDYLNGKLDEMLYERLSFRQLNVEPLADRTVEELCVQPLQKAEPRLIFDHEAEAPPEVERVSSGVSGSTKGKTGGLGKFIGKFLKS